MPFSPPHLNAYDFSASTPTFLPFSDGPTIPFARVIVKGKVYLLMHALMHPWIYWRVSLLNRWKNSFAQAQLNDDTVLWIEPPKKPEESFFIQAFPALSHEKENFSEEGTFLAISWLHYLKRAFLSKEAHLTIAYEKESNLKTVRLVRNQVFILKNEPSFPVEFPILLAEKIECFSFQEKNESFLIVFAQNKGGLEKVKSFFQKLPKEFRQFIVFFPMIQTNSAFVSLHYCFENLSEEEFEAAVLHFSRWFVSTSSTSIRGIDCCTSWKKFHFEVSAEKLWMQYAANWICQGQLGVSLPTKLCSKNNFGELFSLSSLK